MPENAQKFQEEFSLLSMEELDIDTKQLSLLSLEKAGIKISPIDLHNLNWLIVSDLPSELSKENNV
jgi:hypothetical protein